MPERKFPIVINKCNSEIDLLLDNKKQLLNLLGDCLTPQFYSYFNLLHSNSESLVQFQDRLSRISDWREKGTLRDFTNIIKIEDCRWLDNLVAACFISYAKTSDNIPKGNCKGLTLIVPSSKDYIFNCLKESARNIWKYPDIFEETNLNSHQIYENNQIIFSNINKAIKMFDKKFTT